MILPIIIFILTLSVLVVIHELGHFLMAKKFGVKVEEFGFGLPPRIWGKQIGETILSVNALPIGGFVRLMGEDEEDKKILNSPRSFATQKVSKRILIVVMGVLMNFLLSWVLFYAVIFYGHFTIALPNVSPVAAIQTIESGSPAQSAGLKVGDVIIGINGQKVSSPEDVAPIIDKSLGKPVTLEIDRSGVDETVIATPRENVVAGQGALGVAMSPFQFITYNTPYQKFFSGPSYSLTLGKFIVTSTGLLVSELLHRDFGALSTQVAGPIGIAAASTSLIQSNLDSIMSYVYFIGYISLTLSIMNILPIPALDGGRLFFLLVEAVIRRKVNATLEKNIHAAGMVLLLGLFVLLSFSDISKLHH